MRHKRIALLLVFAVLLTLFAGCGKMGQIAESVADAAKEELESQVKKVLQEYKLELVEMKTAAGKLNDNGESVQLFCAVLVRTENEGMVESCADALGKLFAQTGTMPQTDSAVLSPLLVHKSLSYRFSDFADGNTYYTIYVYSAFSPSDLLPTEPTD